MIGTVAQTAFEGWKQFLPKWQDFVTYFENQIEIPNGHLKIHEDETSFTLTLVIKGVKKP